MLIQSRGIVFRTVKFGETSMIADVFTRERGLQTLIASGVRARKAKFAPGLFQPFSVVETIFYFKENAQMHRAKEFASGLVFSAIPFDIRRGAVALFLAETARKAIRESEQNEPLFDFLERNIVFLDSTEKSFANLHLHFLVQLTDFLGFRPGGEWSAETPFFDLQEGVFCQNRPASHLFLAADEARVLSQLLEIETENCANLPLARPLRKSLLTNLLKFYQLHLDGFGEVKTPEVLEMVFEN